MSRSQQAEHRFNEIWAGEAPSAPPEADTTSAVDPPAGPMHIDCGDCTMRNIACDDCVVSVLLGGPPVDWEDEEQRAIGVLAESGLVPPLRLVRGGG